MGGAHELPGGKEGDWATPYGFRPIGLVTFLVDMQLCLETLPLLFECQTRTEIGVTLKAIDPRVGLSVASWADATEFSLFATEPWSSATHLSRRKVSAVAKEQEPARSN